MKKSYTTLTLVIMLLCFKESFSRGFFKPKSAKQKTLNIEHTHNKNISTIKEPYISTKQLNITMKKAISPAEAAKAPKSMLRKTVEKVVSVFKPKSKTTNISLTDPTTIKNVETAKLANIETNKQLHTVIKTGAQLAIEKLGETPLKNFTSSEPGAIFKTSEGGTPTIAAIVKLNNIQLVDGALVHGPRQKLLTDNSAIYFMYEGHRIPKRATKVLSEADRASIKTYLEAVQKADSSAANQSNSKRASRDLTNQPVELAPEGVVLRKSGPPRPPKPTRQVSDLPQNRYSAIEKANETQFTAEKLSEPISLDQHLQLAKKRRGDNISDRIDRGE